MVRRTLCVLCIYAAVATAPAFADFTGKVVAITNGDTIKVMHNGKPEKLRLNGIDCPEKWQLYGQRAKQAASDFAFGKTVTAKTLGHDKFGRTLADVTLPDGRVLNQELVKVGMCWWFRKQAPKDTVLEGLEKEAREAKHGFWADPKPPYPPRLFRKDKAQPF